MQRLSVGIYSGITCLTGDAMTGMPEHFHNSSFIWESGIRLAFSLGGKKARKQVEVIPVEPVVPVEPVKTECDGRTELPETVVGTEETPAGKDTTEVAGKVAVSPSVEETADVAFPVIYFPFNGTEIVAAELPKARRILGILQENPDMDVILTGWCDTRGSREVNDRISLRRADALKAWLVAQGIEAVRIRTMGQGSDTQAPSAKEARRVNTEKQVRNQ